MTGTKKKAARRTAVTNDAADGSELIAAVGELRAAIYRQSELLELALCTQYRQLQLLEHRAKLESGAVPQRYPPDVHGLTKRVDTALTNAAMRGGLLTTKDGTGNDGDSGADG